MDFLEFIRSRRRALLEAQRDNVNIEIVLGNESCDLDSAVGAIAYAFLLHRQTGTETVPVLNVLDSDYNLKTEVVFLLTKYGISQSDLVFINDLDNLRKCHHHPFTVHLVDHNILTDSQADMSNRIKSVVDHHNRDCPTNDRIFIRIETVGSCCSIITDLFYERCRSVYSQPLAHLLRGTILGDSICLSADAGKVRPLDIAMVEKIEHEFNLDPSDRQAVFNDIKTAKENVSDLTLEQILRKDMKSFTISTTSVVMSSMNISIQEFLKRSNITNACTNVLHMHSASVLVILCSGGKGGVAVKHFIMHTKDKRLRSALTELIDSDTDLQFSPTREFTITDEFIIRKFMNTKLSRKQVLPKIKGFLQVIATNEDVVTKQRADSDQLTFSLELSAPGTPAVLESPAPELNSSHENSGSHTPNPTFYVEAPPNSYKDASMLDTLGPHLPSFNNSEMVKRIMIKKNKLTSENVDDPVHGEVLSSGSNSGHNSCPFTPANSFVDKFTPIEHHLPSFNSREMVFKMLQKKIPLAGDVSPADDSPSQQIFTPQNSECGGDLHSSPAFDQFDLEHRLSKFEASDLYNTERQRAQDTTHQVGDGTLEQGLQNVTLHGDNHG